MASYKIKKGDNLTKIAKKYGTTVDALAKANNIKNKNLIVTGKSLTVPGAKTSQSAVKTATKATADKAPARSFVNQKNASKPSSSSKKMLPSTVTPETYKMNTGKGNMTPAQYREVASKQSKSDKVLGTAVQVLAPGAGALKAVGVTAKAGKAASTVMRGGKALDVLKTQKTIAKTAKGKATRLQNAAAAEKAAKQRAASAKKAAQTRAANKAKAAGKKK